MKLTMPLITLLGGATVGGAVLAASVLATSSTAPAHQAGSSPAATTVVTLPSPDSSRTLVTLPSPTPSVATTAPAAGTAAPTAAPGTGDTTAPAYADYAGQAVGGGPSVAVSVHGSQAIAYVCDGHTVGQWFQGTADAGKLDLASTDGAELTWSYRDAKATGYVMAAGGRYAFSAPPLHGRRYGLYESTAVVHGTKIKVGWIVLPGYQVGAVESNLDAAVPLVTPAPPLDLATGTAQYHGVVLVATLISGVTGTGF
jgi:hypothetical protein